MNYKEANEKLTGRCHDSRKIGNNTYLQRRTNAIAVKLHATDVITFHKNGTITLCNGGYPTVTTHDRMNSFLPGEYRVCGEPVETRRSSGGMSVLSRHNSHSENYYPATSEVLIDNTARILANGKLEGGNVQEYRETRKRERNEARRPGNRARYWIRKARGLYSDSSKCTATRWNCKLRSRWERRRNFILDAGQNENTLECGCKVYRKIAKPSAALTVDSIMAETNAAVRTAQITIYGIEKFFLDSKPEILDTHNDYSLMSLKLGDWEDVRALKMTCPSTAAVYVQTVPPNTSKVSEALDWIFQTKDYLSQVSQQA